jgi:hypothetical protein
LGPVLKELPPVSQARLRWLLLLLLKLWLVASLERGGVHEGRPLLLLSLPLLQLLSSVSRIELPMTLVLLLKSSPPGSYMRLQLPLLMSWPRWTSL